MAEPACVTIGHHWIPEPTAINIHLTPLYRLMLVDASTLLLDYICVLGDWPFPKGPSPEGHTGTRNGVRPSQDEASIECRDARNACDWPVRRVFNINELTSQLLRQMGRLLALCMSRPLLVVG